MNSLLEGTSTLSADLQNTKVTPTLCSENTRHSDDRRNAKSLPVSLGPFLYKVGYRNVEILRSVFSYAFDTVPDAARYINLQHSEHPTNIAVAELSVYRGLLWRSDCPLSVAVYQMNEP